MEIKKSRRFLGPATHEVSTSGNQANSSSESSHHFLTSRNHGPEPLELAPMFFPLEYVPLSLTESAVGSLKTAQRPASSRIASSRQLWIGHLAEAM